MTPSIWYSGKVKNYGDNERSDNKRLRGRQGWIAAAKRNFRAVKPLCVILQRWIRVITCQDPQSTHHQEWTLRWTTDSGWWCSLQQTHLFNKSTSGCGMLLLGNTEETGYIRNHCTCGSILLWLEIALQ